MSGLRNPIGDTHYTFVLDFGPTPFCPPYCGNTALLAEVSLSFACSILILRTQEWINQDLCWAWEACCWAIISNPGLIAVCLLQCTVGSVMTIGLSIPVNPLLSPLSNKWPLSNNKCPPLQRRKVNKPPSLLSPPPPLPLPSILILHKQLMWTDQLFFIQVGNSYCLWSSAPWPSTSCAWVFQLYALVLCGELPFSYC